MALLPPPSVQRSASALDVGQAGGNEAAESMTLTYDLRLLRLEGAYVQVLCFTGFCSYHRFHSALAARLYYLSP
jgi:hypothetical protein